MNDTAIRVESLGKRFQIGVAHQPYVTLREVLARAAAAPFRRLSALTRGRRAAAAAASTIWALKDVSFEVRVGEAFGVIGPNGAGKSTLLKVLSQITEPTEGSARVVGRVGSLLEVGIGFHPELTGRENTLLNGAILGMKRAETLRKLDEIVAFAEVERFIDTPVKRYSTGMYLRLAFAVAAHLETEILLVDEVLAVGDAQFQQKCMGKMGDVASQGRTVLFVSHNMAAVAKLCQRVMLLDGGRILDIGEPMDIISRYVFRGRTEARYEIQEHQHNRGSREAEIREARIRGSDGAPRSEFLIGDPIVLEVVYEAKRDFSDGIAFWVIICAYDGTPILAAHQNDSGYMPSRQGTHVMTITIRGPALLPGNYTTIVGIFDADHEFLDWVDGFQSFSVARLWRSGQKFDGRWGLAQADVEWRGGEGTNVSPAGGG